jgi:hypothetical protein
MLLNYAWKKLISRAIFVCFYLQKINFLLVFIWQVQKWLGRTEGLHKSLLILCIILHYFDNKLICQFVRFPVLGEKKAVEGIVAMPFIFCSWFPLYKKGKSEKEKTLRKKSAIWHSYKKNVTTILDLFRSFFHLDMICMKHIIMKSSI